MRDAHGGHAAACVGNGPALDYLPIIKAIRPLTRIRIESIMTTLDTATHFNASALRWSDRLAQPIEGLVRTLRDWNDARVTRAMLSRLSAHELEDIGLCRGDIDAIAARGRR